MAKLDKNLTACRLTSMAMDRMLKNDRTQFLRGFNLVLITPLSAKNCLRKGRTQVKIISNSSSLVHFNEPLFAGPYDHRLFRTPIVRVTMFKIVPIQNVTIQELQNHFCSVSQNVQTGQLVVQTVSIPTAFVDETLNFSSNFLAEEKIFATMSEGVVNYTRT
uniref:Uncharacterized protein n=1 Tax=Romanomermis culicivorax TaxID=13658 RepID=A0A915K5S2_ROMCU